MARRSLLSRLNPRLKWRGVRGIRYNQDGVSALEFALIAPVLILIYLGAVELSLLMRIDRRVTSTSASLGDLTARLATVTDDDMSEMFQAAETDGKVPQRLFLPKREEPSRRTAALTTYRLL